MKLKLILTMIIAIAIIGSKGFSQKDPKEEGKKGHKNEQEKNQDKGKLSAKGKQDFDKSEADYKNVSNASFDIAANSDVNNVEDKKSLLGLTSGSINETEATKPKEDTIKMVNYLQRR